MKNSQSKNIFSGVNWQFLSYFLLFSYIPLMIFSIIGFFVNKSVIKDIHNNYLQEINHIELYNINKFFKKKEQVFNNIIENDQNDLPGELTKKFDKIESAGDVILVHKGEFINDNKYLEQLKNIFRKEKKYYLDTTSNKIYIKLALRENSSLYVPVHINEIQQFLYSINPDYSNEIVYMDDGKEIIITEKEVILHNTARLPRYAHFLQKASIINKNWKIVTYRSSDKIYNKLFTFLKEIFIANIIIGILLFIAAFFLSKKITTPLRSLVLAAEKISKGDLSQPIQVEGKKEIKILSDEFENMRIKLKEAYTDLEIKIAERTKALQDAQFQVSHQEKMASLGLMAAGVAHEIGNPLTSISSMAQIIKRKIGDPQLIEYSDTILENIERISVIVHELVDFARPASYRATNVNINEIIRNAVNIVRYNRRGKQIDLELNLENEIPSVYLVADQLLQVFINILINAVDALTENNNMISVHTFSRSGNVYAKFIDNGIGIPDDNLDKIFQPFYTTKDVGKGTGLGLSVSYGIIKNLNGKIEVKSTVNVGSEFMVEIPIEKNYEEKT